MTRGVFVVIEGIDGCGKTTQARRCAQARGARFAFEPGDSALGSDLRRWLLDAATPMTPESEALLMLADRSYHARSVVGPLLAEGTSVVCDRYAASTLAYQGHGRGVDLERLVAATELAIGDLRPDLTVLLDLPVGVAIERESYDRGDRFESADLAFFERVRAGYLAMASADPTWVVLDGAAGRDEVDAAVDAALDGLAWARG